jgi:hypothetical protein
LELHCRVARMIKIRPEPEETRQRAAAALPAPNRVQGVVPARVGQGRELLDLEAVGQQEAALEVAEQALGEVDHRLALQDSRSRRCATI